jgi:hypothetical protein
VHLLTLDGRRRQRPEFKEGQTGGWPWWPARTSRRCGVPVSLRRRGWLAGVQLVGEQGGGRNCRAAAASACGRRRLKEQGRARGLRTAQLNRHADLSCSARTPRRGDVGLRRSPGGGRRRMGLDGLRAGWHRVTAAGGPGRAGLRFGPRWAAGPRCNSDCAKEQGPLADFSQRA